MIPGRHDTGVYSIVPEAAKSSPDDKRIPGRIVRCGVD